MSQHKIVVYVPLTNTDSVREAIGTAGGGKLGKYSFCSFSTRGIGRFKPEEGAHPHIGTVGELEQVEEERIEVTCDSRVVGNVLAAIKRVHPYEEVAMDVWQLESY
ncbi:NGG1p interacting factor NIF3 [Candidatus Kaiserbacteria bacterium]|nr:NGG1p interacting factor NIF3 [Candidatus Kaiserbacteria bacterium]